MENVAGIFPDHIYNGDFATKNNAIFKVDIEKVLFMLLIHDIVEVDTGDTFLYSDERKNAHFNEERAAERIFGMLEPDQKKRCSLTSGKNMKKEKQTKPNLPWYVARLQPLIQNYVNKGCTWREHDVNL